MHCIDAFNHRLFPRVVAVLALIALSPASEAVIVKGAFSGVVTSNRLPGVPDGAAVTGEFFVNDAFAPAPFNTDHRTDYTGGTVHWLDYWIAFNGIVYYNTRTTVLVTNSTTNVFTRIDDAPANAAAVRDALILQSSASFPAGGRSFLTLSVGEVVSGSTAPLMNSTTLLAPIDYDVSTVIADAVSANGGLTYSPNSVLAPTTSFTLSTLHYGEVVAVPEPQTWLMFSIGLVTLCIAVHRGNSQTRFRRVTLKATLNNSTN